MSLQPMETMARAKYICFLNPLQGTDFGLPEILTSYKINPSQIKNTTFAPQDKNWNSETSLNYKKEKQQIKGPSGGKSLSHYGLH